MKPAYKIARVFVENAPDRWHITWGKWSALNGRIKAPKTISVHATEEEARAALADLEDAPEGACLHGNYPDQCPMCEETA